jgi:pilus assembly protein CpaB
MKPKTMILMVLAIVCGLVASYMTSQLIAQNKEEVTVLRAKKKLNQWYTLRDSDIGANGLFEAVPIAKKSAHANYIPAEKLGELKGRRLRANLEENDHLTEDHLLKKEVGGIDTMLDKGKRAMAVNISADRAVGYFVVPGSRVDVVHTVGGVSNVLLEDILVLAIDLAINRPEDKAGLQGATATLQLDNTEQVLKLSGARDRGNISLVMRPSNDDKKSANDEKNVAAVVPPPPPPPPFEEVAKEEPKTASGSTGESVPAEKELLTVKRVQVINGLQGAYVNYKFDKKGNLVKVDMDSFDDLRDQADRVGSKPKPAVHTPPAPAPEKGDKPTDN